MVERLKAAYLLWLPIHRNFPKSERFGLGQKVDASFLELLEALHRAAFSSGDAKVTLLGTALVRLDSVRFFLQVCWEAKLIPTAQFAQLGQAVETVGRMVGGWRKGILTKTPLPGRRGETR